MKKIGLQRLLVFMAERMNDASSSSAPGHIGHIHYQVRHDTITTRQSKALGADEPLDDTYR